MKFFKRVEKDSSGRWGVNVLVKNSIHRFFYKTREQARKASLADFVGVNGLLERPKKKKVFSKKDINVPVIKVNTKQKNEKLWRLGFGPWHKAKEGSYQDFKVTNSIIAIKNGDVLPSMYFNVEELSIIARFYWGKDKIGRAVFMLFDGDLHNCTGENIKFTIMGMSVKNKI